MIGASPAGGDLFGLPKHWVGATPAQFALAWLLARGDDLAPIPGTQRVVRVEENAGRRRRGPQRRADRIAETELPIEASSSETPNRCWAACSVTPTEHSGGLPRRYRQGEGIAKGKLGTSTVCWTARNWACWTARHWVGRQSAMGLERWPAWSHRGCLRRRGSDRAMFHRPFRPTGVLLG